MYEDEFIKLIQDNNLNGITQALVHSPHLANAKSREGYTALSAAIYQIERLDEKQREARFTILCHLLEHGADASVLDSQGFNFLQNNIYACAYKTADSRKSKQFAKPTPDTYASIADFHEKVIRYLLTKTDKLTLTNNGHNAPTDTAQQKAERFIRDSLTALVTPRNGDLQGKPYSCLNLAVWSGREKLVDLILTQPAALEPIPANNISCVHEALLLLLNDQNDKSIVQTRVNILESLLNKLSEDPDDLATLINSPCKQDYSPVAEKNIFTTFFAMVANDPIAKPYNAKGDTPLHSAVRYGNTDLTYKLLLAHGADLDVANSKGKTPAQLARALQKDWAEALLNRYPLEQLKLKSAKELEALRDQLEQMESLAESISKQNTNLADTSMQQLDQKIREIKIALEKLLPNSSAQYERFPIPTNYGSGSEIKEENPSVASNSKSASNSTTAENPGGSMTNKPSEKTKDYDVVPSEVQAPVVTPKIPLPPAMPIKLSVVSNAGNGNSNTQQPSESGKNLNPGALLAAAAKLRQAKPVDRRQTKTLFELLRDRLEPRRNSLDPNNNVTPSSSPNSTQSLVASNAGTAVTAVRQPAAAVVDGSEIEADTTATVRPML